MSAEVQNVDPFSPSDGGSFDFISEVIASQSAPTTDAPIPQTAGEVAPPPNAPVTDAREDPLRHEHWQSKYDQAARELDEARRYREQTEAMSPLLSHINNDPALGMRVLQIVEESLSGTQGAVSRPGTPGEGYREAASPPVPQEPVAPTRPPDYDEAEAYQDPKSASWRYRREMEDHRQAVQDHRFAVLQTTLQTGVGGRVAQLEQRLAEEAEQAERRQVIATQYNRLVREKGMSQSDAMEFLRFATDPNYTEDHLVNLWRITKGLPTAAAPQVAASQPAPATRQGLNMAQMPLPPTVTNGGKADPRRLEDKIMDSLISSYEGTNPF
jgi:hypothetical protein